MKKSMPPAVPMSTPTAPALGNAPSAIGGTSGPVAPAKPAYAPAAKFNPDNQLPTTAMHKGRGLKG